MASTRNSSAGEHTYIFSNFFVFYFIFAIHRYVDPACYCLHQPQGNKRNVAFFDFFIAVQVHVSRDPTTRERVLL